MSSHPPVTVPGVILPDGTLELSQPHGLGPGPVRVSLESTETLQATAMTHIPSAILQDESISAPCSLPLTGPYTIVTPQQLDSYPLPKSHDIDELSE